MTDQRPAGKLYGVIHLPPLPGTPFHRPGSLPEILEQVSVQARLMADGGLDGVLLQTVDRVYSVEDTSDPARVAAMALCARAVTDLGVAGFELGIQIMRHAVSASLAVAKVCGAQFVRADAIVGATLSTHGLVQPDPLTIMNYRRAIDAFDIRLIADVDSMHYRWLVSGESTGDVARRAMTVGADAVCVANADPARVLELVADIRRRAPGAPVVLGGFVNHGNAAALVAEVDGAFVSGCLTDPADSTRLDPQRIRDLVDAVGKVRA
ncbi:BtpA/SgcQ family protein [Dactylosporangium sp. NPDC051541]|uniref:BtpA/SgcQ family protein n=1 Tax=Dactylosporangium sp. NPDC051541 TaxID=3363977 RepID=UPI0037891CBE